MPIGRGTKLTEVLIDLLFRGGGSLRQGVHIVGHAAYLELALEAGEKPVAGVVPLG
jgi:hypothetical protein